MRQWRVFLSLGFWGFWGFWLAEFMIGLLFTLPAWSYVPTINPSGTPIRWNLPIKLNLVGNPMNQSGLSSTDFYDSVVAGLQRWKAASHGTINFDYWQGSDNTYYPANNDYNGTSSIYFASQSGRGAPSANVLGLTQVWYNTDTGEILETDIVLNDVNFHFTNNPTDTSGFGAAASTYTDGKSNVYIQNVITHELGHALGLSHSGGLQSTMLFMESPEQAHLGCDELVAIQGIYPTSSRTAFGQIQGQIVSESGTPVFGAHVLAISQKRGTVLATTLSNPSGHFTFGSLEPGTYFLMAEPFYAGAQALPAYYASLNASICSHGVAFSRSFLTESDQFHLISVSVNPNQTASAPTLAVHCDREGGAFALENTSSRVPDSAPLLNSASSAGETSFGTVDRLNQSSTNFYRLKNVTGSIKIHALAYSLYSPVQVSLSLMNSAGVPVDAQIVAPVYQGDSGYTNYDATLMADQLVPDDYTLQVRASTLQVNQFPAGPVALDEVPFLVITGTQDTSSPPLSLTIPDNARCRLEENFPHYSSPPGLPPQIGSFWEIQSRWNRILWVSSIFIDGKVKKTKLESNLLPWWGGSFLGYSCF